MSYQAAAAILQGELLIDPAYAQAHLALLLDQIKNQVPEKAALQCIRQEHSQEIVNTKPKDTVLSTGSFGVYSVNPYTSTERLPHDSIIMIDVIGPVLKYGSWYGWGSIELAELVTRMSQSDKVKAILLNIDSPGGQAAGTADFADAIRVAIKIIPVIGVVQDGMAASAAMWIASACQELYVTQPTCKVGSIGAYTTIVDIDKYYEKLGILVKDIYAPQSNDKNADYRQAIEGDDALIKNDLKFLVEHFISNVKSNRGPRIRAQEKEPFTGKMYYAQAAQSFGLIDGVKTLPAVLTRLAQLITVRS
jgi:protease-4